MKHFGNPKNENLLRSPKFYGENEFPVEMCRSQLITEILSFFCFHKNFMTNLSFKIVKKLSRVQLFWRKWISSRNVHMSADHWDTKFFLFSQKFHDQSFFPNCKKNQARCNISKNWKKCIEIFKIMLLVILISMTIFSIALRTLLGILRNASYFRRIFCQFHTIVFTSIH